MTKDLALLVGDTPKGGSPRRSFIDKVATNLSRRRSPPKASMFLLRSRIPLRVNTLRMRDKHTTMVVTLPSATTTRPPRWPFMTPFSERSATKRGPVAKGGWAFYGQGRYAWNLASANPLTARLRGGGQWRG